MRTRHILEDLLLTFMKLGLFTFGGGYAMISMIENICVEKKKWISHDEMMNVTVIAESTPGSIAINCATFVGFKMAGVAGALIATLGMIIPSFCMIYAISMFLDDFLKYTLIAKAFKGIKIAVGILILDAGITMAKKMFGKKPAVRKMPVMIMVTAFVIMLLINIFSWKFSSISLMVIAAAVSLVIFLINDKLLSKGGDQA